jgi:hypothetical protein
MYGNTQRRSIRSNQSGRKLMRMICNFPRMQALRIAGVLFAASLCVPISAQTARIHQSGAQANLRVDVNVVSAVHHRDHDKDEDKDKDKNEDRGRENDAVSYNLNPRHEELSVREEMRPMLVDSGNNAVQQEQVRTITVVPK